MRLRTGSFVLHLVTGIIVLIRAVHFKGSDCMCEAQLATFEQLSFAIFCIEAVAEYLNWDPRDVYASLADKTNLLDDYIARYSDVLHTQDRLYIAEDIVRELKAEGALA